MRASPRIVALLALAACGAPEKPADRAPPEVPSPAITIDLPPPTIADAGIDLDAGADASDPDASAPPPAPPDALHARLAALHLNATQLGPEPVPKRPRQGPRAIFDSPRLYRSKTLRMSEGLPPEVAWRTVAQNRGRFRSCFEPYLNNLSARPVTASVTMRLAIGPNGETLIADPIATTADAATALCFTRASLHMAFPPPTVPLVGVELTFSAIID
jgi:hypothetical protein